MNANYSQWRLRYSDTNKEEAAMSKAMNNNIFRPNVVFVGMNVLCMHV